MDKVAAVAKMAEQHSARELTVARQSHQENCDQLEQLVQFKNDYEATLGSAGGKGMAAKQLQDYRLFMSKLNQAIDKQAQEVELTGQGVEGARDEWISKSQRKSALEQLLHEQHKQQVLARDKLEQKASDENSMARGTMNWER